jgi:hypothetical protein
MCARAHASVYPCVQATFKLAIAMYPTWYPPSSELPACYDAVRIDQSPSQGCRMLRCNLFVGLLLGCAPLEDGTSVMRTFPAVDCDKMPNRALIAWLGAFLVCLGVPAVCVSLIVLYVRRSFSSSLAYFLTRSIFSGHTDSAQGFGFRVFLLARTFGFVVIAVDPTWLGELSQAIGFGGLFTLTLFLESLSHPRTTHLMNVLESVEEMILATVLAIGFLGTGLR